MRLDTTNLAWLADLCAPDRPTLTRPGIVTIDGESYTVATDGRMLLAVRGEHVTEPHQSAESIAGFFHNRPAPSADLSLAGLRAFLGPFAAESAGPCDVCNSTRQVTCPDCRGTGDDECECRCGHVHDAECDNCGGDGTVKCACQGLSGPDPDPFRMGGVAFDQRLVARLIRHLPDGDVPAAIMPVTSRGGRMSFLYGDNWLAIVMPLASEHRAAPEFPVKLMERAA